MFLGGMRCRGTVRAYGGLGTGYGGAGMVGTVEGTVGMVSGYGGCGGGVRWVR